MMMLGRSWEKLLEDWSSGARALVRGARALAANSFAVRLRESLNETREVLGVACWFKNENSFRLPMVVSLMACIDVSMVLSIPLRDMQASEKVDGS